MEKMFLVTNCDLSRFAGDTTLFLRRAEAFFSEKNIVTYCDTTTSAPSKQFPFFISKVVKTKKEVIDDFLQLKPEYVLIFGTKSLFFLTRLKRAAKKHSIKSFFIIDIQSYHGEKAEYSHSVLVHLKVDLQYAIGKYFYPKFDGAFVTAEELIGYCKSAYLRGKSPNFKFYLIRCGTLELPDFSQISVHREQFREKHGISKDSIVFCYAGFLSSWQRFDDIVCLCQKYDKLMGNAYFCFFCPANEEQKMSIMRLFPKGNCLVAYLQPEEYKASLDACDVGLLLRDYNMTNKTAFPNKFSDYLASGMILAINRALPENVAMLERYNFPFIDSEKDPTEKELKLINQVVLGRPSYLKKCEDFLSKEMLYSSELSKFTIGE